MKLVLTREFELDVHDNLSVMNSMSECRNVWNKIVIPSSHVFGPLKLILVKGGRSTMINVI